MCENSGNVVKTQCCGRCQDEKTRKDPLRSEMGEEALERDDKDWAVLTLASRGRGFKIPKRNLEKKRAGQG